MRGESLYIHQSGIYQGFHNFPMNPDIQHRFSVQIEFQVGDRGSSTRTSVRLKWEEPLEVTEDHYQRKSKSMLVLLVSLLLTKLPIGMSEN